MAIKYIYFIFFFPDANEDNMSAASCSSLLLESLKLPFKYLTFSYFAALIALFLRLLEYSVSFMPNFLRLLRAF